MSDFLDLQGAKDLNTDAIHIRAVANSKDPVTGATIDTHTNRAGGTDYTLQGFWGALGPVVMSWTSTTGGTLTQPNQAFLHPTDGNYYSWVGAYPSGGYVVAPGTDPTAVTGYVPRTDVVLREQLASPDGSSLVSHTNSISTLTKSVRSFLAASLCIDDFIPSGLLPNSDHTAYVQKAFKDAFAAGCELCGTPGMVYNISATILIPVVFDNTFYKARLAKFDGRSCVFNLLVDATLFESAYLSDGELVSNFGTELDSHYSQWTTFGNFSIQTTNPSGVLHSACLKIQDWHQGCRLHDISSSCASFGLYSANNYYTEFDNLVFTYPITKAGTRFIFSGSHNLNIMRRLAAVNAEMQYRFDGPVTALVMDGCSFEGATVGAQFNGAVYDLSIQNCYIENISDVAVFFASYFHNCKVSNNYVNFINQPTMYFMGYADTPVTGIEIGSSNHFANMPDESHIIKTKSADYGTGITIRKRDYQESDHRVLIVDSSTYGDRVRIEQEARFVGYRGRKVRGHIVGNYAGKFTEGSGVASGFTWLPSESFPRVLEIKTSIIHNLTELAYINIFVAYSGGITNVSGFLVGGQLYKFTTGGVVLSSDLSLVDGADGVYVRLQSPSDFTPSAITGVTGEIRII